ncbi:hypothetical protein KXD40_002529 [Peronospora effusa]|uniref:Uncharacterized protein n=1 Tax=Peronospora effusa TaxID=542832 RepID=A0A3M6VVF2_9STRA|nr:hypothetical protein DD238_004278 [Peronospora effusa]RQM17952.1 hypothetical protein DD237_001344 [Peronospora effusa]UIZ26140.1 hypothetical protein KXD40_002529 [Peronospora effusa]CAI5703908.1 unnamed protein product [Peronospora effusa]
MSAKSPEVVDSMISDSLLGIFIILLAVLLSTGYMYMQQLRQGDRQRGNPHNNVARMMPSIAAALASIPGRTVCTTDLNDRQLRLHYTLPMRNGARIVTISGEVLLKTDNMEALSWINDEVPALLADLSQIADVYLMYTMVYATDIKRMERIREFISTHPDLKSNDTKSGGIKKHKILFCTTSIGKIAFVRQIEPHVHVDADAGVVRDLEKHVPRIVHIPALPEDVVFPSIPNVIHVGDSFSGYFSLISSKERL